MAQEQPPTAPVEAVMGVDHIIRRRGDGLGWKLGSILLDVLIVILIGLGAWFGSVLWKMEGRLTSVEAGQKHTISLITEMKAQAVIENAAWRVLMKDLQDTQKGMLKEIQAVAVWRAEVTANRFTDKEGSDLEMKFIGLVNEIKTSLARLPVTYPPSETKVWMGMVETRINKLELRIEGLRSAE